MIEYALGFAFCGGDKPFVLLQEKLNSEIPSLNGTWNGIGGKIEIGETPLEAMERESDEETGIYGVKWEYFCTSRGNGYTIHVFWCSDPLVWEYEEVEGMRLRLFDLYTIIGNQEFCNFRLAPGARSLILHAFADSVH